MGCSREMKESEKIMENIFKKMLQLNNCVWFGKGMKEEVHELTEDIQLKLTKMVNEFDNE